MRRKAGVAPPVEKDRRRAAGEERQALRAAGEKRQALRRRRCLLIDTLYFLLFSISVVPKMPVLKIITAKDVPALHRDPGKALANLVLATTPMLPRP